MVKINNRDWDKVCTFIQGHIEDLCNHDITKDDCYEEIKSVIKCNLDIEIIVE